MKRYVLISEDGVVETDTTSLARAKQYVEAALVDKPTGYTVSIYQHVLTGSKTGVVFNKNGCAKRTVKKAKVKKAKAHTHDRWSRSELDTLRGMYEEGSTREQIEKAFPHRSPASVQAKRTRLGMRYKRGPNKGPRKRDDRP